MAASWPKIGDVAHFLVCSVLLTLTALSASSSSSSQQTPSTSKAPLVLLISFDGFRWDYLDRTETPNFDNLIADGVKAKYLFDSFPSKTFPNHYTIVTGLYQESHGMVGNSMYDPLWNETFSMGSAAVQDAKWWNDGEPIWVNNQRHGGHSGVIMYPAMDVKIHGSYPSYRLPKYNESFPFEERIDIITDLFANGSINLGVLYFHEPDHSGHEYGPDSPKMDAIIRMCDSTIGYLMTKLRSVGLDDQVDVIITSDHGMTAVSSQNFTQLDDFVEPLLYRYTDNNPVCGIWPYKDSDIDVIYNKLRNASPHVMVYKKDDIPEQYNYHDHRRISPILLVAKEGWAIHRGNQSDTRMPYLGNHGYNNSLMSMHPIFIAHGPSFRQGLVVEPFENVDIYPLMCQILGIAPAPNNGSLEKVKGLLRSEEITTAEPENDVTDKQSPDDGPFSDWSSGTIIGIAVAGAIAIVACCLLFAMCVRQRTYRQQPREYMPIADTSLDAIDGTGDSGFSSYNYPNTKI